jgi:hypothetical protein
MTKLADKWSLWEIDENERHRKFEEAHRFLTEDVTFTNQRGK